MDKSNKAAKNIVNFSKKGIILLENILGEFQLNKLKKALENFGAVRKILFISNKFRYKNSKITSDPRNFGLIEFFDKVQAKIVSFLFRFFSKSYTTAFSDLKVRYLKGIKWENLGKYIEKKNKKKL